MTTIEYENMRRIENLLFINSFDPKEIKQLAYTSLNYKDSTESQREKAIERLRFIPGLKKLFLGDTSILANIILLGINGTYFVDYAEDLTVKGYVEHMTVDFDAIREHELGNLVEELDDERKIYHEVNPYVITDSLELNAKPVGINERLDQKRFRHRVSYHDTRIDGSYRLLNLETITDRFVPIYQLYIKPENR